MTAVKALLWALCLTPAAQLAWRAYTGALTANPIEFITLHTGFWTLVLIMATLAVTPLRRITGWNRIIQIRRPLGLFAFFYALLHFLTYVALDLFFDFSAVAADVLKRPYITVGFTAFVLLIPLAFTSTKGSIRRLGRNWLRL
ncbi:MAG: sulfoxide reductase heme-binding subunit YedZ, partial [Gemmatimonadetes bacterium]|nr:sulfoxide reductase heme-binding subunit YedZ [Gemmatimonadota bacterium]